MDKTMMEFNSYLTLQLYMVMQAVLSNGTC